MSENYTIKRAAAEFHRAGRNSDKPVLTLVTGFEVVFHTIGDLRFYVYENKSREWYVNEVDTGLKFASGVTKKSAVDAAWNFLSEYHNVDKIRHERARVLARRAESAQQTVGASA